MQADNPTDLKRYFMDKSVDCVHCRIAWMCFVSVSRGLRDLGLCYRSSCPDWNSQKWRESSCAHVVQTVIQRICDVLCDMYGLKLWFSECQVLCYMSWTGFESLVAVFSRSDLIQTGGGMLAGKTMRM